MSFPKDYVDQIYVRDPGLAKLSVEEQRRHIFSDFFSFADSWEYWLRRAGVDAIDIPHNVAPLDAAAAREFASQAERSRGASGLTALLRELKPDVLFLSSLERWTPAALAELRTEVPTIRAVLGMAGVDVYHLPVIRHVDAFVTCMKGLAARLRGDGMAAFFMPHAFDPRVLDRVQAETRDIPFAFFGNVFTGGHWHDHRRTVLEALVERCGLILYSDSASRGDTGYDRFLKLSAVYWAGRILKAVPGALKAVPYAAALQRASEWPSAPRLPRSGSLGSVRPPVYGLAMYRALAGTRMTVNVHVGIAGPYAANMRLFEATGMGTCLLTDAKSDLHEFFQPDEEVVSFVDAEDAVAKASALLADPRRMMEIGRRGQARTLRDHSYEARVPTIMAAAQAALSRSAERSCAQRAKSAPESFR